MKSQVTSIHRLLTLLRECWPYWLLAASILLPLSVLAQQTEREKLAVRKPSAPQVQETDVKSLSEKKGVKRWKPGDPVRIMEDLKKDGQKGLKGSDEQGEGQNYGKPIVRKPVQPRVFEKDLSKLSKVKPYQPGDPVRVMEDLKKSGSQD